MESGFRILLHRAYQTSTELHLHQKTTRSVGKKKLKLTCSTSARHSSHSSSHVAHVLQAQRSRPRFHSHLPQRHSKEAAQSVTQRVYCSQTKATVSANIPSSCLSLYLPQKGATSTELRWPARAALGSVLFLLWIILDRCDAPLWNAR